MRALAGVIGRSIVVLSVADHRCCNVYPATEEAQVLRVARSELVRWVAQQDVAPVVIWHNGVNHFEASYALQAE